MVIMIEMVQYSSIATIQISWMALKYLASDCDINLTLPGIAIAPKYATLPS